MSLDSSVLADGRYERSHPPSLLGGVEGQPCLANEKTKKRGVRRGTFTSTMPCRREAP